MTVVNSTYVGCKHCRVLIKVTPMFLNKVVIHVPKPLRTGGVAMEAVITCICKRPKRLETPLRPLLKSSLAHKKVQILKMELVILEEMLNLNSTGKLFQTHSVLEAGPHPSEECEGHCASVAEFCRKFGC